MIFDRFIHSSCVFQHLSKIFYTWKKPQSFTLNHDIITGSSNTSLRPKGAKRGRKPKHLSRGGEPTEYMRAKMEGRLDTYKRTKEVREAERARLLREREEEDKSKANETKVHHVKVSSDTVFGYVLLVLMSRIMFMHSMHFCIHPSMHMFIYIYIYIYLHIIVDRIDHYDV